MIEIILAFTGHFLPGEWNEVHPGIRYEQGSLMGAFFMNSEGNPSLALGYTGDAGPLFYEIGGATGYSGGPVVPFLRAGIEFERFRFFVAPSVNTDGDFGAVIGVETIIARF